VTQRIITSSEIRAWKGCPKKWWFRYDQELVPVKTPIPLSYGRLVHQGLEAYYRGEDALDAVSKFFEEESTPWGEDQELYVLAEACALLRGYIDRDPVKPLGHTVSAVEHEGVVPLRTPGGRRWHHFLLGFKIDLETDDRYGNLWAWDHKTAQGALNEAHLALDDQMAFYSWALAQLGRRPQGVVYNLIRKPSIKPRQNEEPDAWQQRLSEDIVKRPEFYFQRSLIVKSESELAATAAELWSLAHSIGREPIHRNPSSCQIFGCAYREICIADTPLSRSAGYRHERAHIELQGVV